MNRKTYIELANITVELKAVYGTSAKVVEKPLDFRIDISFSNV